MPISLPSFLVKGCGEEAPHTGTTIIACKYKDANGGGVVLGADGRVSVGNCESMADVLTCMALLITLSSPPRHFKPSVEQDCTPRRARLFAAVRISP